MYIYVIHVCVYMCVSLSLSLCLRGTWRRCKTSCGSWKDNLKLW